MKILPVTLLAVGLAVLPVPALAAFASAQPIADNPQPPYPPGLVLQGITDGSAVLAVSIDTAGRVTDTLVLGYTNPQFVRATLDVIKDWRFTPARLDGEPVPVQTELRFDYSLKGAVITTNIFNHFFFDNFENAGDRAWVYQPGNPAKLDSQPNRVSGRAPAYAKAAEKEGVRGRIEVRFYIDENGAVRLPAVTAEANPYLAEQAVAAVRDWKFAPLTSHGRPVLVVAEQAFDFGQQRP